MIYIGKRSVTSSILVDKRMIEPTLPGIQLHLYLIHYLCFILNLSIFINFPSKGRANHFTEPSNEAHVHNMLCVIFKKIYIQMA